jgi:hypothetical protein
VLTEENCLKPAKPAPTTRPPNRRFFKSSLVGFKPDLIDINGKLRNLMVR